MKKLNIKALITALFLSVFAGSIFAQISVLQEDFSLNKSNISGTKQITLSSGVWDVFRVDTRYNDAVQCAVLNYSGANMGYIITPAVNRPGVISFDARMQNSKTVNNYIEIQKSVNGEAFITIDKILVSGTNFQPYSVVINETSDNVRIKFLRSRVVPSESSNYNVIIDNITVSGSDVVVPEKPELAKISTCVDAGLPGTIEVEIVNYDAGAQYNWDIDADFGSIASNNGGVFTINTVGKEGSFSVSVSSTNGTSNTLHYEVIKDSFVVRETVIIPNIISVFVVDEPFVDWYANHSFTWTVNGLPCVSPAGFPYATNIVVMDLFPQQDSVIYVTVTNNMNNCTTRKYREAPSKQFRAVSYANSPAFVSSAGDAATTYNGSFYKITDEIPTFMTEVEAMFTNNGSSYTIDVGTANIDNIQMDAGGNLSRDGYVSADGSNYFFLSGYIKNDSLVFRYGQALTAINPETILFTFEFRGKIEDTNTALTQPEGDIFTLTLQPLQITIAGTEEPVSVYNLSGQQVAQGTGAGTYSVPAAGVYIVKVGSEVRKVIVSEL
jgi:hypothetical protein